MKQSERKLSRRRLLKLSSAAILLGQGQTTVLAREDADTARTGSTYDGSERDTQATPEELLEAIATAEFSAAVNSVSLQGVSAQAEVLSEPLQSFPLTGGSYAVLSSGEASDASGYPTTFVSTDMGGETILGYSPDGYDANDVVTLNVDFTVPSGAEALAFDFKFGSEENPEYLNSEFQDFFEAIFITPDGAFENIALLPDGSPVTVANSDAYANSPNGLSNSPTEPFPDPPDVTFNSVTELLTAQRGLSALTGQDVRLRIRVADATDSIYDSAAFIDDLRFTGELEDDLQQLRNSIGRYTASVEDNVREYIRALAEAEAELFVDHGSEFTDDVVNYFGYVADVVDSSQVTGELIDVIDPVLSDTLDGAEELYEFKQEMYDEVSSTMSVDQISEVFFQYYMGTYDGQENYYLPEPPQVTTSDDDPDRIIDLLSAATGCRNARGQNLLAALSELDLTQSDIDKFVEYFDTVRSNEVRDTQKGVKAFNRTATNLTGDTEIKGTIDVPQFETESESEVGSQFAVTGVTMAGITLIKVTGAISVATYAVATVGPMVVNGATYVTAGAVSAASSIYSVTTTKLGAWSASGSALSNLPKISSMNTILMQIHLQRRIHDAWQLYQQTTDCLSVPFEALALLEQGETQIATSRIVDAEITDLTAPDLTYDDQIENTSRAKGTGSVTIQNTGAVAFTPDLKLCKLQQEVKFTGVVTEAGYPLNFTDEIPEIQPGETVTLEFEYVAPLGWHNFATDYQVTIDLIRAPVRETSSFTTAAADLDFDVSVDDVIDDAVSIGDSISRVFTTRGDTKQVTYSMNHSAFNADLHLYDDDGNHTGYNYQTGQMENQIPNATHSGRDLGIDNREWVTVTDAGGTEFTVETVVPEIGTVETETVSTAAASVRRDTQETETAETAVSVKATEVPDLAATLELQPPTVSTTVGRGEAKTVELTVNEVAGANALSGVSFSASDLIHENDNDAIPSSNVSFSSTGVDVEPGDQETVKLTVSVPDDVWIGDYTTEIAASGNGGETTDTMDATVTVQQVDDLPPVGEFDGTPVDIDGDGRYEDVNGDGVFDIVDAQALFANLDDPVVQNNPDAFDFNGDGVVNVVDVQRLFNELS